jgi:hypothetical protein
VSALGGKTDLCPIACPVAQLADRDRLAVEKGCDGLSQVLLAVSTIIGMGYRLESAGNANDGDLGNLVVKVSIQGWVARVRVRCPVQPAVAGSHGFAASARVMASRAVRPWFAVESR